ncbi:MAG TPA: ABC transporter ATP-binding protein, partial [Candidatus Lustribacter sp.]|nr:ABC transporter ATP-binding protein [Candidatus Lustribacter sp.]
MSPTATVAPNGSGRPAMEPLDQVPPVIEFARLSRTYPGPPPVPALRPCDLVVRRGEHVAVVGPSGSGKSTLLNVLGLLDRPTAGTYHLDGIDVGDLPERDRTALRGRRIGFVFQAFHLLPHRDAVENVLVAMLYADPDRRTRRARAVAVLTSVGLGHRLTVPTALLSGGERQRVAIARALVNRPSLLLCDEPTGNLDSSNSGTVLALLEDLHRQGITLLVITHDAAVAGRAQRVVTIRDGELSETPRSPGSGSLALGRRRFM